MVGITRDTMIRHFELLENLERLNGWNLDKAASMLLAEYPLGLYCEEFVYKREIKAGQKPTMRFSPDIVGSFTNEDYLNAL